MNSDGRRRREVPFSVRTAVCIALAFVVIDCFPKFGAPHFRYTGSDPAHHVWNLGWPFVLAIYDSRSGLHFGPFVYAVIPLQGFILMIITFVSAIRRRRRSSSL
jgi:hypothetical protein